MKRLLVLILALILCGASAAAEIDWRALEGGELMVYVGCDEVHGAAVVRAFEEKTGIATSYIRLSGNACYRRILQERDDPQADVWYGGTWDPYIAAANEGLLYPCEDLEHAPYKSKSYGIGEPNWFGIYSGYMGFICNMEELERAGVGVPETWEDLAKPEYAGLLCLANPESTGTGVMTVSILCQRYGEERGLEILKGIDANTAIYTDAGSGVSEAIAAGDAAIGVGFLHTGLMYIEQGYDHLRLFAPVEGTGYEVGGTAILAGAKHPEEAKLFLQFAMSPECQEIGQTVGALQFPTVEGAKNPEPAQILIDMGINLIDYNAVWTAENKDRLIEAWKAIAGADE